MQHAQLWKRILNQGVYPTAPFDRKFMDDFQAKVIKSTIIVVQKEPAIDERLINLTSYKACAIPFDSVWIEQSAPEVGVSCGWLLVSAIGKDGIAVHGWEVNTIKNDSCIAMLGQFAFLLNKSGDYVPESASWFTSEVLEASLGTERANANMRGSLAGCLDVLTLLSCKNIALSDPKALEKKQAARAAKRFGRGESFYKYHTLVIRPAGAKDNSEAKEIGVLPWHMCRGHHSYYGPASISGHPNGIDNGLLFGKYAGRFYVMPHARGDKKNGVVEKDYEVRETNNAVQS